MDLGTVCFLGFDIILLAIIIWAGLKLGKAMWNTEKKVWRWMNDDSYNRTSRKSRLKSEKIDEYEFIITEEDLHHTVYAINGKSICVCDKEYGLNVMTVPYPGVFITPERDLSYFTKISRYPPTQEEIIEIYKNWLEEGRYELVVAWYKNYELACGTADYLSVSYYLDYSGMIIKEGRSLVRIFTHDCRGLTNKSRIIKVIEEYVNNREIGEMLRTSNKLIIFGKGILMRQLIGIDKDILSIYRADREISFLYDIKFTPLSKKDLLKMVNKAEKMEADGVLTEYKWFVIGAVRGNLLSYTVGADEIDDLSGNFLIITDKDRDNTRVYPIPWKNWNRELLIQTAKKFL